MNYPKWRITRFSLFDQRVETSIEAKLHRHDAWELYYVVHGYGNRMAGDTLQPFAAGDVALIPPSMLHSLGVCARFSRYGWLRPLFDGGFQPFVGGAVHGGVSRIEE